MLSLGRRRSPLPGSSWHGPALSRSSPTTGGCPIRNSTLRELVALSYGVPRANVTGGDWLDNSRYDIRVQLREPVADPDNFDPVALRGVVNRMLARVSICRST